MEFEDSAEYTDQVFKKITYAGKVIKHTTFDNCTFNGCSLQETQFQNCKFADCTFQDSDLRLIRVTGSTFRNTQFKKSNVTGVNWAEGSWSKKGLLQSIGFEECDISHSTFIGLTLPKIVITKCTAKNADFAEADLTHADCTDTDFIESRFLHTNLTEADFTHARHYAIDATLNTLKKAKFALPEAINLLRCMNIILLD